MHRQPTIAFLILLLLGTTLWGCGSTGAVSNSYRTELGRAPSRDVMIGLIAQVFSQYGYQLLRPGDDRVTTEWQVVMPDQAEATEGVLQGRERLTITLTTRGEFLHIARMTALYEAEYYDGTGWQPRRVPQHLRDRYRDMERDLKRELEPYMTQEK